MKSTKRVLVLAFAPLVAVISLTAQASVEVSTDAQGSYVMCRNDKTVRTLRVEQADQDKNCVAFYTKSGVDREVVRAQSFAKCSQVVDNIKGNLEKANWKCKDVKSVSFSSSSEE